MSRFTFDSLSSTQDHAMILWNEKRAKLFDVVVAKTQTKGRGQFGRKWISDEGNLYVTFIAPHRPLGQTQMLVCAMLYTLKDVFKNLSTNNNFSIKLPNDLLKNGKKIGGVLVEQHKDCLLLGIGINVRHSPNINTATHLCTSSIPLEVLEIIQEPIFSLF